MNAGRALVEKLGFAEKAENIWWSYDQKEFSLRTSAEQVYLESPAFNFSRDPLSIYDESLLAAKKISERHSRPTVLLSGGIDSEVAALSFHIQHLPFDVVIIDYAGHNEHDIYRAKFFCQKLGIPYRILSVDILKFWENDLETVAKKVHCTSPQIAALCWASTQIDGYIVVGDGDTSLRGVDRLFVDTKSEIWALARWMLLHQKEGCPRFFQYTPELEACLYFEPMVEQFVAGAWEFFDFKNIIYLKPFIMHKYFDTDLRAKLNGFENLSICDEYRNHLTERLSPLYDISWTYDNGRSWALQRKKPTTWIDLQKTDLSQEEKSALGRNKNRHHLMWVD